MANVENLHLPAYVKVESKLGTLGDLEGKTVLLREIDYDVPTYSHYGKPKGRSFRLTVIAKSNSNIMTFKKMVKISEVVYVSLSESDSPPYEISVAK